VEQHSSPAVPEKNTKQYKGTNLAILPKDNHPAMIISEPTKLSKDFLFSEGIKQGLDLQTLNYTNIFFMLQNQNHSKAINMHD
jgi:hypothetical protein